MFNLKIVYFRFLASKIVLLRFLKEIYFRTSYYNNSLKENNPKQFNFFPNPFLLSSFVSHKNFAFKLKKINTNNFWNFKKNTKESENLNNFYWLNLINRKNDGSAIQEIITFWIKENKTYKKINWKNTDISKRIISWILNADIILNNTNFYFKENFFQSILTQVNHLKINLNSEDNPAKKIEIISAILLSGLIFKEYNKNFETGIKELKKIVEDFFDEDGFPINRNIYDLVQCSKFLVLIKECCKDAQEYIPDFLDDIVDKIIICVNSIRTSNNKNPLFNGSSEFKMDDYFNYLSGLDYNIKNIKNKIGNIYVVRNKKNTLFFDVGSPPKKRFSKGYQSGPLSFEYYINNNKIITNCGYGNKISKKAELISRLTSAQSTLSIDDTSVVKFERSKLINNAFGTAIKSSFEIMDISYDDTPDIFSVSAKHNAYEKNFNYTHSRLLKINKKNSNLYGQDDLFPSKDTNLIRNYNVRFHLYPGVSAVQTMGKSSILISVEKNKSLIFKTNEGNLSLEKSIFLGRNQILNNFCINISGTLVNNEYKSIKWELKKSN